MQSLPLTHSYIEILVYIGHIYIYIYCGFIIIVSCVVIRLKNIAIILFKFDS